MPVNTEAYKAIKTVLDVKGVKLIAVSKTKTVEDIFELYNIGHRDFGENYVQELVEKATKLPGDIRWHYIGHLQTNKVKLIVPFVQLIHGVDSLKLLQEINKQAVKVNRVVDCLLQVYIAKEETKYGLNEEELATILKQLPGINLHHIQICGLMGMASFTDDMLLVKKEFQYLKTLFDSMKQMPGFETLQILSMGMSSDYLMAVEQGSTMVRIGSLLFGDREKKD